MSPRRFPFQGSRRESALVKNYRIRAMVLLFSHWDANIGERWRNSYKVVAFWAFILQKALGKNLIKKMRAPQGCGVRKEGGGEPPRKSVAEAQGSGRSQHLGSMLQKALSLCRNPVCSPHADGFPSNRRQVLSICWTLGIFISLEMSVQLTCCPLARRLGMPGKSRIAFPDWTVKLASESK